MLCTVGDLVTDVVVHLETDPKRGTDTRAAIQAMRGGSAANIAVAAVAAGGSARFVGQVGDDPLGHDHVRVLREAGVDLVVRHAGTTGTIVVLVDASGERSFLTDRAAAISLATVDPSVLDEVAWLHVPGYSFLEGPLATTSQALVFEARERDIPVSLSTSSVSTLAEFGRTEFLELIRVVEPEVVIANNDEARHVLREGQRFPHATWTVITRGAHATSLVHADGSRRSIRPEPSAATDTTGAGDAFTGAMLVAMLNGEAADAAVAAGHRMAARTLRAPGAQLIADDEGADR